jgi:hypothetical protein
MPEAGIVDAGEAASVLLAPGWAFGEACSNQRFVIPILA